MPESASTAAYRAATGLSRGELAVLVALVACPGIDLIPAKRSELDALLKSAEGMTADAIGRLVRARLAERVGSNIGIAYVPTEKGRRRVEEWSGRHDTREEAVA